MLNSVPTLLSYTLIILLCFWTKKMLVWVPEIQSIQIMIKKMLIRNTPVSPLKSCPCSPLFAFHHLLWKGQSKPRGQGSSAFYYMLASRNDSEQSFWVTPAAAAEDCLPLWQQEGVLPTSAVAHSNKVCTNWWYPSSPSSSVSLLLQDQEAGCSEYLQRPCSVAWPSQHLKIVKEKKSNLLQTEGNNLKGTGLQKPFCWFSSLV